MDKLKTVDYILIIAGILILALPIFAAEPPVQVAESSVFIKVKATYYTPTGKKEGWSSCSGVFITPNVILSAAHCIPEKMVKQQWFSYLGKSYRFDVYHLDRRRDLALLTVFETRGKYVKIDPLLVIGEDVWAYGFPLRIPGILTKGIVSNPRIVSDDDKVAEVFFDTAIFPGSSGGGLYNKYGHLVGITVKTTSFARGAAGLGIAVSVEEILKFIREATAFRRKNATR